VKKITHAKLFCRVLPLKNAFHIITDSEEEISEKENDNVNAITHRTVSIAFCILIIRTAK
jgi:hypothetical protein